ncbi:hypothetical protein HW555_011067 [Spodoptera exigua]|uniref:Uncharacterized protein n=1 Tax=Spodoptera exigua TaxID=7107 RepID=A0A835G7Q8_SPOEX|nr:hypothetical protein HW555_011067 [Spodoptera exigua]
MHANEMKHLNDRIHLNMPSDASRGKWKLRLKVCTGDTHTHPNPNFGRFEKQSAEVDAHNFSGNTHMSMNLTPKLVSGAEGECGVGLGPSFLIFILSNILTYSDIEDTCSKFTQ